MKVSLKMHSFQSSACTFLDSENSYLNTKEIFSKFSVQVSRTKVYTLKILQQDKIIRFEIIAIQLYTYRAFSKIRTTRINC